MHDFSLPNHSPKQGITTYLNYKLFYLWSDLRGLSLLTLGLFPKEINNIFHPSYHIHGSFSKDTQLLLSFPLIQKTSVLQITYHEFPFQKCSFDRIIYIHDPHIPADQLPLILRSCWDTLSDHGLFILVVPNKLKWWNLFTPISIRKQNSFFLSHLQKLLKEHMFQLVYQERILYFPLTLMNSLSLYKNKLLEFIGHFFIPFGGGYHLLEVRKNLYAPISILPITKNEILKRNLIKPHWNCKNNKKLFYTA